MRHLLKNEVHRTLKQAILRHRPAHVAVESLDFRSPELSRRMNRLVQNFGRKVFCGCATLRFQDARTSQSTPVGRSATNTS
jgi:hypothetical protein